MQNNVYIALGSNIGDRLGFLGKAILHLSQHPDIEVQALSSIYETEPVGYVDQEAFYNMVIEIATHLSAAEVMELCLEIEQRLGRVRTIVNGPRTVDLDLVYYDDFIIDEESLTLPHPRLQDRSFVLVPLVEIAADFIHPILQAENKELLSRISLEGVRKLDLFVKS